MLDWIDHLFIEKTLLYHCSVSEKYNFIDLKFMLIEPCKKANYQEIELISEKNWKSGTLKLVFLIFIKDFKFVKCRCIQNIYIISLCSRRSHCQFIIKIKAIGLANVSQVIQIINWKYFHQAITEKIESFKIVKRRIVSQHSNITFVFSRFLPLKNSKAFLITQFVIISTLKKLYKSNLKKIETNWCHFLSKNLNIHSPEINEKNLIYTSYYLKLNIKNNISMKDSFHGQWKNGENPERALIHSLTSIQPGKIPKKQ